MKKATLSLVLVFIGLTAVCQPGDPGGDPDNPVPLHGIGWLLAAGGIYGARKLLKRKPAAGDDL